jgi:ubiquitin conjugation factor E4 B
MNNIVRSGPKGREAVLAYLGNTAKVNAKRAAMRVDPNTVSSHGFIINLHTILLSFAQPFMDSKYSKARWVLHALKSELPTDIARCSDRQDRSHVLQGVGANRHCGGDQDERDSDRERRLLRSRRRVFWHVSLAVLRAWRDLTLVVESALPAPNFISEIFFLCCTYLHIGIMHTIKEHKGIRQQIGHMGREIADMEADTTWRGVSCSLSGLNQREV